VKRRGKSPPPGAQATGQEKPHVVQDKTGGRAACPVPGRHWPRDSFRVLVASAARTGRASGPGATSGRVREMIVPGMQIPATEFGLSPFANGGAFGDGGASSFFAGWVYLVERWGISLSTNNSRKRNIRGRFIASLLEARRETSRPAGFLPMEVRIFMRNQFSTAHASVLCGESLYLL